LDFALRQFIVLQTSYALNPISFDAGGKTGMPGNCWKVRLTLLAGKKNQTNYASATSRAVVRPFSGE